MALRRLLECFLEHGGIVGQDAEIGHHGPRAREQVGQQKAVGVVYRRARARASRFHDLVAGRKDRGPQPAPHGERGDAERGGECYVLRRKHGTGSKGDLAFARIFSREPSVGATLEPGRNDHHVAFARDVFLHEYGVGASRHGCAGKDANRFARLDGQRPFRSRCHAAANGQTRGAVGTQIRKANGVAVDGGVVERRQIDRRTEIVDQGAPVCLGKRYTLDPRDRYDAFTDQAFHLVEPQQRTGKRKTIVGKLSHQTLRPNPAASIAIAWAIRRSAIASTSSMSTTGTFASGSALSAAIATMCGSVGWMRGLPFAAR